MRIYVWLEFRPGHGGRTLVKEMRERSQTFVLSSSRRYTTMSHVRYRGARLRLQKDRSGAWRVNIYSRGQPDRVLGSFVEWIARNYTNGVRAMRVEFVQP